MPFTKIDTREQMETGENVVGHNFYPIITLHESELSNDKPDLSQEMQHQLKTNQMLLDII